METTGYSKDCIKSRREGNKEYAIVRLNFIFSLQPTLNRR